MVAGVKCILATFINFKNFQTLQEVLAYHNGYSVNTHCEVMDGIILQKPSLKPKSQMNVILIGLLVKDILFADNLKCPILFENTSKGYAFVCFVNLN